MSAQLDLPFFRPLTSCAVGSRARTCPAPAEAQVLTVLDPASGGSSPASSKRRARAGSSSRTWPAGLDGGCLLCGEPSGHGGMTACLWASPPVRLALGTGESGCSLLLTLTVKGNYNRAGASSKSGDGLVTALLPTLTASRYGSNQGGSAGRTGPVRLSLEALLPTLLGTDAMKAARDQGTSSLGRTALRSCPRGGGYLLDPGWCEAFMGFPVGWTEPGDVPDGAAPVYAPPGYTDSGTPLSPPAPKSSGGSSPAHGGNDDPRP